MPLRPNWKVKAGLSVTGRDSVFLGRWPQNRNQRSGQFRTYDKRFGAVMGRSQSFCVSAVVAFSDRLRLSGFASAFIPERSIMWMVPDASAELAMNRRAFLSL